ncbi:phage tail protein [Paenibacillus sp. H1-7]|uniref:phage tail protein n=1 Tax=Paenibacillus sp. H1-7 TaxID=2282849 RepID=UPI0031F3359A
MTTFALPDLRGRVPLHVGEQFTHGEMGGEVAHTLILSEMPSHTHPVYGSDDNAASKTPANNLWAKTAVSSYNNSTGDVLLSQQAVRNAGGSQPHNNMQPYLTLNICIALQGIFPSRN